jgi:2-polyprenyl-6-methoxyphenol hydroxylase-like FAD-dependent oxidoreductase
LGLSGVEAGVSDVLAHAAELPVVVAGAGPAGASAAIGLKRAGVEVMAFEARGEVATRARNIFLRPQARDILTEMLGADPGRDSTINSIENRLRAVAATEHVPIGYDTRVLDAVEHEDHVAVTVQHGDATPEVIKARTFIDASGGRLQATNAGELERVETSKPHMYVTAQYATPAPFGKVFGAHDPQRDEMIFCFPISDGNGFIVYYDLPPGQEQGTDALLARYDALAGSLQLGTPISPPQAFNATQHLSKTATLGRMVKIGDSAGNADPYIGAGVAAGLVDAKKAVEALTKPGNTAEHLQQASRDILNGHRLLGWQAQRMVDVRGLAMKAFPDAHFDERLKPDDLDDSRVLDWVTRGLTSLPIP